VPRVLGKKQGRRGVSKVNSEHRKKEKKKEKVTLKGHGKGKTDQKKKQRRTLLTGTQVDNKQRHVERSAEKPKKGNLARGGKEAASGGEGKLGCVSGVKNSIIA